MRLLSIACFFILFSEFSYGQKTITGRISDGKSPLSNVQISNLNSRMQTASDAEGRYQIQAQPREELQFTYMGMDTVLILVEDVTRILNITMNLKVEELEEVTVTKSILKGQKQLELEYNSNPNIIKTAFGYLDKNTSSFPLRLLDEKELESEPNLNSVLMGRFAGVTAFCDPETDELFVKMRSIQSFTASSTAVFDIDGLVVERISCSQLYGNLRRIAFISSLSALTRYGSLGAGGVVVINTKSGTMAPTEESGKPFDQAKLRNNYVKEGDVVKSVEHLTLPSYLKSLQQSQSVDEAINIYNAAKANYGNHPNFLLDSYTFFYEELNEESFAEKIKEQFVQAMDKNPVMLKALAYTLENEGRNKEAHEIYKKVYTLRPNYAQSFIDMANSYRNLGQPKSATTLYARHAYLQDEGMMPVDSMELGMIMKREIKNLFTLESGTLKINTRKYKADDFSTRLVFEWNDSEAEFDLQFVNPGNQYFNWKHTMTEMPERIHSEKKFGYSMADFLMDDELPGIWKVNATYHGNKQLSPSYLKVTIYRNYGSKLQSKETKVFRLGTKGANQHLFDFNLTTNVANN